MGTSATQHKQQIIIVIKISKTYKLKPSTFDKNITKQTKHIIFTEHIQSSDIPYIKEYKLTENQYKISITIIIKQTNKIKEIKIIFIKI